MNLFDFFSGFYQCSVQGKDFQGFCKIIIFRKRKMLRWKHYCLKFHLFTRKKELFTNIYEIIQIPFLKLITLL